MAQRPNAALAQNDRAAEVLARDPNVAAVYSLSAVCPSPATQEANIRRWREFWTPARARGVAPDVGTRLAANWVFAANAFAKFWQRVEGEPALLTLDMFRGTPLEQALSERVALGTNDNAVSTLVKLEDRAHVGRSYARRCPA